MKAWDWFLLTRPWSLTATTAPLVLAAVLARGEPSFAFWRWALAFVAAALLHLSVNLLNAWGDDKSGVDRAPGAICTTPQLQDGRVAPSAVLRFALILLGASALCAAPLFFAPASAGGGLAFNVPLAAVVAVGACGAVNYTTLLRFKYRGLGVPFVFFLMGILEVLGASCAAAPGSAQTFFAPDVLTRLFVLSLPIGTLVSCLMQGNDMRDVASDRSAGITTLAMTLGFRKSLVLYVALHLAPYGAAIATAIWTTCAAHPGICARTPLAAAWGSSIADKV